MNIRTKNRLRTVIYKSDRKVENMFKFLSQLSDKKNKKSFSKTDTLEFCKLMYLTGIVDIMLEIKHCQNQ